MAVLADFGSRRGIMFPMLSDSGSSIIKQYGILNTTIPATNPIYGVPFPGTFVLDRAGVVTASFFEDAYQERDTIASVLTKAGAPLGIQGTSVSVPHLAIATFATDRTVAPGTHFSLVLDIEPAPHVHVYAPGVSGYKPIALDIQPQPGLVVRGARFPKADDYFFEPLREHVPVYQHPFRIVQDVEIDPSPSAAPSLKESLTITAELTYQACSDTVCFVPQTVPLSWTVDVKPLDRERSKVPRPF